MPNGSPYYANGFNAYWLMYVPSDPSQRYKVSAAFQEASSHSLTVARTWACSDGGYRDPCSSLMALIMNKCTEYLQYEGHPAL